MSESALKHIEFFDHSHFANNFHRVKAKGKLNRFIDFFWEIKYDELLKKNPEGFTDMLFPDIGYTYLINLGTPFRIQLNEEIFVIKSDSFLPRNKHITTHHAPGNKLFGIKFKVSPVIFLKDVDFSEYTDYIFPLVYLIDKEVVQELKEATTFDKRVQIATAYYEEIIKNAAEKFKKVTIVTEVLDGYYRDNDFDITIETISEKYGISTRTLQRYFEATTSVKCKEAFQLIRIRKAITHFIESPKTFAHQDYGYYDSGHFFKDVRKFLENHPYAKLNVTHKEISALQNQSL